MSDRPYVSFAEVKEKVPIPDVLTIFGVADRFKRSGDTLTGVCPFPSHHHGPMPNGQQFKINRKDGVWLWHCFGDCQRGGDVLEFVKAMTGLDNAHVRFWFAEKFSDRLTLKKPKTNGNADSSDKPAASDPPENDTARDDSIAGQAQESPQAASHTNATIQTDPTELKPLRFFLRLDPDVAYLKQRGLTAETIKRYGLGLCNRGLLRGYVAIPIVGHPHAEGANPLAYLGRWPGDDFDEAVGRPRYKWPNGFPKSRVVYGLREATSDTDGKPLIVTEGPFKVFHLTQVGFPNTVAVFGSSLSDEQADILAATGRSIVLLFDGNEAGQNGMRQASAKLIPQTFVRVVQLPDGQAPDDLPPEQLAKLLP